MRYVPVIKSSTAALKYVFFTSRKMHHKMTIIPQILEPMLLMMIWAMPIESARS